MGSRHLPASVVKRSTSPLFSPPIAFGLPPMSEHTYPGGELDLFAQAQHWKSYWITRVRRFIGGSVLEVGAGTGTNTLLLHNSAQARWVCLEPDPKLAAVLAAKVVNAPNCPAPDVRTGTLASLAPT